MDRPEYQPDPKCLAKWKGEYRTWHGPGRNTRKGYYWRYVRCEYCGMYYRDLRIEHYFGMDDPWECCKEEVKHEAAIARSNGEYKFVTRRTVLGRMFQYKQQAWREHLSMCEEHYYNEPWNDLPF